jgi:hypothetical protein
MKFLFNRKQTPGTEHDKWYYRWPASIWHTTKVTLLSSYVNVLIVFVPLGIAAGELHWNPTTVFILNFFAIVPLAAILSFGTEEISIRLGQTLGGLMNASFGNVVELIVSITGNAGMRLLIFGSGQYCGIEARRNSYRSSKYARQYLIKSTTGTWMRFHSWRYS